jgi:hypothetical protein
LSNCLSFIYITQPSIVMKASTKWKYSLQSSMLLSGYQCWYRSKVLGKFRSRLGFGVSILKVLIFIKIKFGSKPWHYILQKLKSKPRQSYSCSLLKLFMSSSHMSKFLECVATKPSSRQLTNFDWLHITINTHFFIFYIFH